MAEYQITGDVPARQASGHSAVVPYQAFEGSDGPFMILAGNDRLFVKLAHALDKPEWADDVRYKTNADRVDHRDEILAAVQTAVGDAPRDTWVEKLRAAGVPSAPIQSIPEVLKTDQTDALEIMQNVPETNLNLVGMPICFDGERPAMRMAPPDLGSADDEVFGVDQKG
jgi:crotonobetainyl-CoA:carnitine CoA-transferase CaiB-like acyl-CoA transferase